jgi:predicted membrane protein
VSYRVEEGRGRLIVEQPSRVVGATWPGNVRYDWDLKLNSTVPMELEVDMGVGKSEVDLKGLNLRRFSLEAGVGEGSVDLSGPRTSDLDATIKAGVGKLTLILPTEVGVRVKAQAGLGHVNSGGLKADGDEWVNDAWGKTNASVRVVVEGGIGEVEMRLATSDAGSI